MFTLGAPLLGGLFGVLRGGAPSGGAPGGCGAPGIDRSTGGGVGADAGSVVVDSLPGPLSGGGGGGSIVGATDVGALINPGCGEMNTSELKWSLTPAAGEAAVLCPTRTPTTRRGTPAEPGRSSFAS